MRDIFLDNKYSRWYYAIIERRANADEYSEVHHIVPRSLGGSDGESNLVRVSARTHFVCHWLLTKMTVDEDRVSMLRAFWMMRAINSKQNRYINSRAYEALKSEYALVQSERMMGENNPMFGTIWSDEQKQAQADKVRGDNNGMKSDKARDTMRKIKKGVPRGEFSDEWRANLSASRTGEKNHRFGKSVKDSTRQLIKEKAKLRRYSDETNDKRRDASSGRKEITDGSIYKKVKLDDLQSWLDQGWIVKGKPRTKKQAA